MPVILTEQPFEPWNILGNYESGLDLSLCGAASVFSGRMRSENQGQAIREMWLEHYPGMTSTYLNRIIQEAALRFSILDGLIVHRVGRIIPTEAIVLVACWAIHRQNAIMATRTLLERLKHEAPFWKQETLIDGEKRWVTGNTPLTRSANQ